jgi:hypothetical protein
MIWNGSIRTVEPAARACVSETAHPAMQATIKAAALAANNPVLPI